MSDANQPLVVGAGPVGLAAALFLARQGRIVRVVEMLDKPARESRALAVNPRTLEILEPTGITRQMLELGLPIRAVSFHREEKELATLSLAGIHHTYPFMLALSQASTERLLARALDRAGGTVERGIKMVDLRADEEGVVAVLAPTNGGTRKAIECEWMVAADGAHSTAGEKMKLHFPGSALEEEWYLADVQLRTRLPQDHSHIFLFDRGRFVFMLRVVDDSLRDMPGEPPWRIISNRPEPLAQVMLAEQVAAPMWESSFRISHRLLETMALDNVYFAGDAAHLHSPIGARGMNLGVEDAWVFSELVRTKRMGEYDALRRPIDRRVVRRVELLTRMMAAQSPYSRVVRQVGLPVGVKTPMLRGRMIAAVTGLDHQLPEF